VDRWNETKAVLDFWFPWLSPTLLFAGAQRAFDLSRAYGQQLQKGRETRGTLSPALREAILQANQCDEEVFAILRDRFEQQLGVF
jgi:hypothetical protein